MTEVLRLNFGSLSGPPPQRLLPSHADRCAEQIGVRSGSAVPAFRFLADRGWTPYDRQPRQLLWILICRILMIQSSLFRLRSKIPMPANNAV